MSETIVLLGADRSLLGILARPERRETGGRPGVVILNAGRVHRSGPHRMHVTLARRLAALGRCAVRFDLPGVGDSPAREHGEPVAAAARGEAEVATVRSALDRLAADHGIERFVLVGLCSGGALAFRTAVRDPRVVGVVPINPYHGIEDTDSFQDDLGSARFYLTTALRDPRRWRRFLTGASPYGKLFRAVRGLLASLFGARRRAARSRREVAAGAQAALARLAERNVPVLAIFSAGDASLGFLRETLGGDLDRIHGAGLFRLAVIPRSDHTFTLRNDRERLVALIEQWVQDLAPA